MEPWQLLTLDDVTGGDTYELAFARSYDGENSNFDTFWRPEYLYIPDEPEGIGCLSPYLSAVFPVFAGWYGEQKITLAQWDSVERLALAENPGDGRENFFAEIRFWLEKGNEGADYFWWFGI